MLLIDGGLNGDFNAPFAKMLMSKHGYSDKVEADMKSSDGSMSPTVIELIAVGDDESTG